MERYVFDSCSLSAIINNYYVDVHENFWTKFHFAIHNGYITSIKEVKKELQKRFKEENEFEELLKDNKILFPGLSYYEMIELKKLMENTRVHDLIKQQKLIAGEPLADPMIIAKAIRMKATVVTEEQSKINGIKIPTVCEMYDINCINLKKFLIINNWKF